MRHHFGLVNGSDANVLIGIGVLVGMVVVYRRYLPDFRRAYGDKRAPVFLVLFLIAFPLFVAAAWGERGRTSE